MLFDNQAKNWDIPERIERAKHIAVALERSLDLSEDLKVLEFGCGTGLTSFSLSVPFKEVVLLDASKGMIEVVQEKIEHYGIDHMRAVHGDLTSESILEETFDLIHTTLVLHHIDEVESILEKLYKRLKPGGVIAIVDLDEEDGSFHAHYEDVRVHHGFEQGKLRETLEAVGFSEVQSKTFYHGVRKHKEKESAYSLFLMVGMK